MATIGIDPTQITLVTEVAAFRPGTIGVWDDPVQGTKEYVYGRAGAAFTGLGFLAVEFGIVGQFAQATTANTGFGNRLAVAPGAMAVGQHGWFQVYGQASLRTLASAAVQARLNTTATSGAVDDDGTALAKTILGATLLVATGGAAATNPNAILSYPVTGAVI